MHTSSYLAPNQHLINPSNFTNTSTIQVLTTTKSYVPITTCILEHILTTKNLCHLERLFYLLADSLSLIRYNKGKSRNITLSAKQWAKKLNCSISEIFALQQSLEEKGYFEIFRDKNKGGKNMKNIITPTLPDSVFMALANTTNKFNIDTSSSSNSTLTSSTYKPSLEGKRAYLDRTKMFIKLNYDLLSSIVCYPHLTKFSKVVWVDFYATGYRYYLKHKHCGKNGTDPNDLDINESIHHHDSYSLTTTYKELQDKYSCSKSAISKILKELETLGFLTKKRFFVKNDDDEDNLHDKSIWRITVTLPYTIQQQLIKVKDRVGFTEGSVVSNSDPYVADSRQHINKYFILNTKNLDSIDDKANSFEKVSTFSPETLSKSSVFYKNSFEKEKKESTPTIPCQTKIASMELLDNSNLERNEAYKDKTSEVNIIQPPTYQVRVKKATTLTNTKPAASFKPSINNKARIKFDKTTCQKVVKFFPNSSLKDWYPLTKGDVDKLNLKSGREFSNNFVNELLLKLCNKYPDRTFPTKNHALSYMTKALQRELHQGPLVNHETFRFSRNDEESIVERKREKYLSEVETSIDTSYESQLRRKIAATLEPKLAYQLLTRAKFITTIQEKRSYNNYLDNQYLDTKTTAIEQGQGSLLDPLSNKKTEIIQNAQNHSFTIKLTQDIQLSNLQQQTLENVITAVYGSVDITYQQMQNNYRNLNKLSLKQLGEIFLDELDPTSIWYKIRIQLKEQFGSSIDKSWFSKLTAEENLQTKTLTLFAPSHFMRDWINNKYGYVIKQFAQELGFQFIGLVTKKQFLDHIA